MSGGSYAERADGRWSVHCSFLPDGSGYHCAPVTLRVADSALTDRVTKLCSWLLNHLPPERPDFLEFKIANRKIKIRISGTKQLQIVPTTCVSHPVKLVTLVVLCDESGV